MKFSSAFKPVALALCLGLAVAASSRVAVADSSDAQSSDYSQPLSITIKGGQGLPEIVVPAGKSRLVHFDHPFREIVVGSKDIVHVVTLSRNSIYILGKKRGTTNLTITDGHHSVVAVVDVDVTYDVDGLKRRLAELVPAEHIDITPAGNALILSGQVASADDLHKIVAVADNFAPKAITNLLRVGGSQQVMLEVKFAEVQRSVVHNLGISVLNANLANGGGTIGSTTLPAAISEFGTLGGVLTDFSTYQLHAKLKALETRGLVRTLAEPNLVALSGQTASFLAGGEFPIPVVQSSTGTVPTTTIEYKNFGVGLSFSPTVVSTDAVNLVVSSEVSALDDSISVTNSGISVPGLKVRRAKTTVEMRDGQTFAIAGLIQDDFSDTLNAIPGLGDIPILGQLFHSSDFNHHQSELVVFITVRLVQPVDRTRLASPTDTVQPPSETHMDLFGHTENEKKAPPPTPPADDKSGAQSEGYVLP